MREARLVSSRALLQLGSQQFDIDADDLLSEDILATFSAALTLENYVTKRS